MARKPAAPTRIQKSGNGHTYYLDGEHVPGVTSILSDGIPKNGLIGWASSTVADFVVNRLAVAKNSEGKTRIVADDLVADALAWNAERTKPARVSSSDVLPRSALVEILSNIRYRDLDEAANRGTEVHKIAEKLAHGEEVEIPDAIAGHVASYVRFLEEWQPREALVEAVVVNRKWRYMGKTDLIATVDNLPDWLAERLGKTTAVGLFDVKTSRSGIFAEVALQLEAYRRCEVYLAGAEELPMPAIDFVAAIHVRADGYDVYAFDVETERRPTTFDIFLYAKQVGSWLDWKKGAAATIKSPSLRPPRRTEANS